MESEILTPLEGGPVANTEAPAPTVEEGQAAVQGSSETETEQTVDASSQAAEEEVEAPRHPGPYSGTVTLGHEYQRIKPGTVSVTDKNGNVGTARDGGTRGDKESSLSGGDVKDGKIVYKPKQMELMYNDGKGPDQASDLEVKLRYQGLIYPTKKVFAWHAYVFQGVQDGKIKLYNPWGSWHPDPLTAEEFQTYYSNLSTNQVPQTKETEATE